MTTEAVDIATRRVEIFEMVVHDMNNDKGAAEKAEAFGIRTVPAVVVDGFLLACCKN